MASQIEEKRCDRERRTTWGRRSQTARWMGGAPPWQIEVLLEDGRKVAVTRTIPDRRLFPARMDRRRRRARRLADFVDDLSPNFLATGEGNICDYAAV